jgi:hypothetical protein
MSTVNLFFQSGRTIGRSSEQNLYEDLIIESMKIYGFEVYYIPRSSFNPDRVLTEDPLNYYENAYPIEMYMETIGGFEGDGELLTKFGLEIRDSANFIVARKRWSQTVGDLGNSVLENRPAEGDVIYFPLTKSFFEIRKVDAQTPFFQVGKLYTFKMYCELMQFSSEQFDTGIEVIDEIADSFNQSVDKYELLMEDGFTLLQENETLTPLLLEYFNDTDELTATDNDVFRFEIDNVLDFSERNPFGEPR